VTTRHRLAAFGSSRTSRNDPAFRDVESLCERIGKAGWNGLTGGHQGMMAAFSQGICAGGGHVRGVTLERFPTPPENSLSEEIRARDFFDRMRSLIEDADAYLVLPGGLGTLAELAMTWDLLSIRVLESRPLILYGQMWTPLISMIREQLVFSVDHTFDGMQLCSTHDEVLDRLHYIRRND